MPCTACTFGPYCHPVVFRASARFGSLDTQPLGHSHYGRLLVSNWGSTSTSRRKARTFTVPVVVGWAGGSALFLAGSRCGSISVRIRPVDDLRRSQLGLRHRFHWTQFRGTGIFTMTASSVGDLAGRKRTELRNRFKPQMPSMPRRAYPFSPRQDGIRQTGGRTLKCAMFLPCYHPCLLIRFTGLHLPSVPRSTGLKLDVPPLSLLR